MNFFQALVAYSQVERFEWCAKVPLDKGQNDVDSSWEATKGLKNIIESQDLAFEVLANVAHLDKICFD